MASDTSSAADTGSRKQEPRDKFDEFTEMLEQSLPSILRYPWSPYAKSSSPLNEQEVQKAQPQEVPSTAPAQRIDAERQRREGEGKVPRDATEPTDGGKKTTAGLSDREHLIRLRARLQQVKKTIMAHQETQAPAQSQHRPSESSPQQPASPSKPTEKPEMPSRTPGSAAAKKPLPAEQASDAVAQKPSVNPKNDLGCIRSLAAANEREYYEVGPSTSRKGKDEASFYTPEDAFSSAAKTDPNVSPSQGDQTMSQCLDRQMELQRRRLIANLAEPGSGTSREAQRPAAARQTSRLEPLPPALQQKISEAKQKHRAEVEAAAAAAAAAGSGGSASKHADCDPPKVFTQTPNLRTSPPGPEKKETPKRTEPYNPAAISKKPADSDADDFVEVEGFNQDEGNCKQGLLFEDAELVDADEVARVEEKGHSRKVCGCLVRPDETRAPCWRCMRRFARKGVDYVRGA
ncbi:hypothetical protein Cob_v009507 [Colletotrichum orbiculare MAFF 240422]|uniref:Uncharacterized protein n=1 Tax=Colletotrichum orbiculare (strain 104-T / ATCC 96160 / CBS 514.97 / LARS 414 / MAFF 240422) TaxID=1213857 RepID=N4VPT5_COLOR|nr:hypothetical protein Cob_v009507 [Colletotrichum orbiculare MAFF 240422]